MKVLEKTLSGAANQSSNRDPFSDDEPAVPSKKKPAPEQPAPAKSVPEQPAPAKAPIDDNPFENPFN